MVDTDTQQLAYDAAKERLGQQDATLGNLRNRATGLLAAATVGTSVATAVGLYDSKASDTAGRLPTWASWVILVLVLGIGISVFKTLWPSKTWSFGPSASKIWEHVEQPPGEIYPHLIPAMISAVEANNEVLRKRFWWYRAGVILIIAELLVLLLALIY